MESGFGACKISRVDERVHGGVANEEGWKAHPAVVTVCAEVKAQFDCVEIRAGEMEVDFNVVWASVTFSEGYCGGGGRGGGGGGGELYLSEISAAAIHRFREEK